MVSRFQLLLPVTLEVYVTDITVIVIKIELGYRGINSYSSQYYICSKNLLSSYRLRRLFLNMKLTLRPILIWY